MEEAGDTPPKTSCRAASPTIDHLTTIRSPNPPSNAPVEDLSIVKRLSDMSPKVLPVETIPQDVPGSSYASASQDLPETIEEPGHKPLAVIQTGDALRTHDGRYYCDVALISSNISAACMVSQLPADRSFKLSVALLLSWQRLSLLTF
jgi:hypothetical protein